MSQDIVADALNEIWNAKKARKEKLIVKRYSKLLLGVLKIMGENRYIKNYKEKDEKTLEIEVGDLEKCQAIKPRFHFGKKKDIETYIRRFLPSRLTGIIIVSTSKGLMTHHEAVEKNIGGCLIAYIY